MATQRPSTLRAPNFTLYEKQVLIDLVSKRKSVVENNKTDAISAEQKIAAWSQLATEFNSTPKVHQRSAVNLRTGYDNLKRNSKKNAATEKVRVHKTGGGDSPSRLSTVDEKVLALLGPRITPLTNPFDSDAEYNGESRQSKFALLLSIIANCYITNVI